MDEPNTNFASLGSQQETVEQDKSIRISKCLAIVSAVSVLLGAISILAAFLFRNIFPLGILPFILLFTMAPVLGIRIHPKTVTKDKHIKKTSRLAIASLVCIILAIAFIFLPLVFGPVYYHAFYFLTVVAFVLGGIAFVVIAFRYKELKGRGYVIIALALAIPCALLCARRIAYGLYEEGYTGKDHLRKLGRVINRYAEDYNGYLPTAKEWCDLLLEYDKSLSRDTFKHPLLKNGICNFAFNENLGGLCLADVPGDVVLLFESDGNWNLTGEAELLKERQHLKTYVLFVDGSIYRYSFSDEGVLRWDDDLERTFIGSLRWKP